MVTRLMEIVLEGNYFGQQIINRWNYLTSSTPATVTRSFALAAAFGTTVDQIPPDGGTLLGLMLGVQHTSFTVTSVFSRAVYDVADFYEAPFVPVVPGAQSGEAMSPVVAFGFKSNRVRTDIRGGKKRLAGVPEGSVTNGGLITVGMTPYLEGIAVALGEDLTYDDEGTPVVFAPCIVGRDKVNLGSVDVPRWTYRYYPTEAEQLLNLAIGISWVHYPEVRTQNSRQYGRGS